MPPYFHTAWQRVAGNPSDRVALQPATGPAFSLVSRPGGQVTLTETQVFTVAMNIARTELDRTAAIIGMRLSGNPIGVGLVHANFGHHLEYCFRPGPAAPTIANTLSAVRDYLNRIRVGVWGADVQIVDSSPTRGNGGSGYVRCSYSELLRLRDPARELNFAGRIHIRFGAYNAANTPVNQRNAGTTIVHEAAHKFCGARDWLYNGGGSAGYVAMLGIGIVPALPVLTNQQALNNADSYAEFVMAMP